MLSELNPINNGIPQGSILGPLLFLIFFNDVRSPLGHSKIIPYANDTVIFTSSRDIDELQSSLSRDLDYPSNWFHTNELTLTRRRENEVILFGTFKQLNLFHGCQVKLSASGSLINTTSCYKYLGEHLYQTLNFKTHFFKKIQEGSRKSEPLTMHPFQH